MTSAGKVLVSADLDHRHPRRGQRRRGRTGIAIIVPIAEATQSGATRAYVGKDTRVAAGALDVIAAATTTVTGKMFTLGIGFASGSGGRATAVANGDVEAYVGPERGDISPTDPRDIVITGAALVRAFGMLAAKGDTLGVSVGGVAVGGVEVSATIGGSTRAYVGEGVDLSAGSLTVETSGAGTPATARAPPRPSPPSVPSRCWAPAPARARRPASAARVEASIGANANLTVSGALKLNGRSKTTVTSDARGGAGSIIISVSVFFATATITGGTVASIGAGASVSAGSVDVFAVADDQATAKILAVSIGLGAGAGGKATATVDADVEAFVGPRTGSAATTLATTGTIDVSASASQSATANVRGGGGGGVAVSWLIGEANVLSTVQAFLADGTTVPRAGGVKVRAEAVNAIASATSVVGSGGVVAVGGVSANATSDVSVNAFLGDAVTIGSAILPVDGDVEITATGRGEADATGNAYGGGGVAIGVPTAKAKVDPDVDAHVGTAAAARTTVVYSTGSIRVRAELSKSGTDYSDRITQVSATGDTLTFTYPTVSEGTQVKYSLETGDSATAGLHAGNIYTVLDAGQNLIRLGALFDVSGIDPLRETISFTAAHGFNSGDCVWYDPRDATSMIRAGAQANDAGHGCGSATAPVPGATRYFVRVLDQTTIKLTSTYLAATAASDALIGATPVSGTELALASTTGMQVGTALVYRAPVAVPFISSLVNVTLKDATVDGQTIKVPDTRDQGLDNIYVGTSAYNALNAGDALRYSYLSPGASTFPIGLSTGGTYYAIKSGDGYTIKLADSYCHAVGGTADPASCTDTKGTADTADDTPIPVVALNLTVPADGDGAQHRLERSLGGLIDGQTYYVRTLDTGTGRVTLAATPGGPAITLDASRRPGPHTVGITVDLVTPTVPAGGSRSQALIANLTTSCTSACGRLLAPSGQPLDTVAPPAGDGRSSASAQGGTGGGLEFTFPYGEMTGTPSVSATLAADTVSAGDDIELKAISAFDVGSSADTAGGGAISVGKAVSSTDLGDAPTTATVASATALTAGRDIVIQATTDHTLSSTARSVGGGLIAGKIAYTHASVDNDTTIAVGDGASILAARAVKLQIGSGTTAKTYAETYSVALGAGADSDNTNGDTRGVRIGSSGDQADRGITVGGGVQLTGQTVDIAATVTRLDLAATALATAYSPIFFGVASAFADPYIDVYSNAFVQVLSDGAERTRITGLRGVDIEARHRARSASTGPWTCSRSR